LLYMAVPDLALKLIPAALPKLTEDQNTPALEALAYSVGYGLQQMMLDYGHHVVAKYLHGGDSTMIQCMSQHMGNVAMCCRYKLAQT